MEQKELDGKVWEVSGFVFENEEQAKLAKKEVEGIQYIHDNMNIIHRWYRKSTRESWLRNCSIHR